MPVVQIVNIQASTRAHKRYKATLNNGKIINFGLDTGSTYIDHHSIHLRTNYRKRHYASQREKPLLENLTPSASALSYYLLWGDSTSLSENIQRLNRLWSKKKATG